MMGHRWSTVKEVTERDDLTTRGSPQRWLISNVISIILIDCWTFYALSEALGHIQGNFFYLCWLDDRIIMTR